MRKKVTGIRDGEKYSFELCSISIYENPPIRQAQFDRAHCKQGRSFDNLRLCSDQEPSAGTTDPAIYTTLQGSINQPISHVE